VRPRDAPGSELAVGDSLGPYRLEEMLGEGGMGFVFRAVREPDGLTVALKVLKRQLSGDGAYEARFRHEARAAREVEHGHLVPIVDAGEIDGRHYLAAKFLGGGTLQDRLDARGRLPLADTLRLASEIGGGLDALHAPGLVHRDVKPSNIMLDEEGSAALTDFGLAKGPAYTVLTKPGMVMGTVDYIAPELIRGEPASPASDLYALGCVVFECLAGSAPFESGSIFETVTAHLEAEPRNPCAGRDDAPPGLSEAVLYALAKEPGERPRTARAYTLMLAVAARAGAG